MKRSILAPTHIVLCVLMILVCGCTNEPPTYVITAPKQENFFRLEISTATLTFEDEIQRACRVQFQTDRLDEVPSVLINQAEMAHFNVVNGVLEGAFHIAYSDSVCFCVSAGGDTTQGTIRSPGIPSSVYSLGCGDRFVELVEDSTVQLAACGVEFFSWSCWGCEDTEYFTCSVSGTNIADVPVVGPSIGFTINPGAYEFMLEAWNGPLLEPGAEPNVVGDYGSGYVRFSSGQRAYGIELVQQRQVLDCRPVSRDEEAGVVAATGKESNAGDLRF